MQNRIMAGDILCLLVIHLALLVAEARYFLRDDVKVFYSWSDASYDLLTDRGFGFIRGGVINFQLRCPEPEPSAPPDLWLLLCSMSGGRKFTRIPLTQLNYRCHQLSGGMSEKDVSMSDTFCQRVTVAPNSSGTYHVQHRVSNTDFYRFVLLQCPNSKGPVVTNLSETIDLQVTCSSALMTVNPGNEQLSSDEIPMIYIYDALLFIWIILIMAWLGNFFLFRRYSNKLHKLLTFAPILKLLLVSIILSRWRSISDEGLEFDSMDNVCHFFRSLEDALMFTIMLIVARGWGLLHCTMNNLQWGSFIFFFLVFAVSLMCIRWVHNYFLAFSICCVVFLTYKTLKCCSLNIEYIQRRRRKFRHFVNRCNLHYRTKTTVDDQLLHKVALFTRFRFVCAAFSLVFSLVVTLAMFLSEYAYVQALTYEVPKLMAYVAIGVIFRLRNFGPFEHIEVAPPKESVIVFLLPEVALGQLRPEVILGVPEHDGDGDLDCYLMKSQKG
ncbi:PREDICTED: uncharacterized protein LOC106810379 [Priapulus caudatus]|uniref:Uncharacterized protein LOC106810379 n=1 Tax=Priapulus caudatus TaxID=37621 RepID=A0ABM1EAG7_PRICU|nr:PREDICTED: uncharacterized protein LOC106810379 [Priapulus caudatus]